MRLNTTPGAFEGILSRNDHRITTLMRSIDLEEFIIDTPFIKRQPTVRQEKIVKVRAMRAELARLREGKRAA